MKRLIGLLTGALLVTGVCVAGPYDIDYEKISVAAASTNAAAIAADQTTNTVAQYGWVDAVVLDLSGYASPTVDVDVVTSGSFGGERTLLSIDSVTADGVYPVRDVEASTAGVDSNTLTRIFLCGDKLVARCYDANVTNTITLDVYVVISPTP